MGVYLANIPAATDLISVSQGQIQTNFQTLNTGFGIDHFEYDNATIDRGKHKHVSWVDQTGTIPTAVANELVAYGVTTGGVTTIRYQKDNNATVFTLNPIKAYARVGGTGVNGLQTLTAGSNFNVTSVSRTGITWTVTLTQPMSSATNYSIIATGETAGAGVSAAAPVNSTSFVMTVGGASLGTFINFMVLES